MILLRSNHVLGGSVGSPNLLLDAIVGSDAAPTAWKMPRLTATIAPTTTAWVNALRFCISMTSSLTGARDRRTAAAVLLPARRAERYGVSPGWCESGFLHRF